MKSGLCWKTQDIWPNRAKQCLPGRNVYKEWKQSKREKCAALSKPWKEKASKSLLSFGVAVFQDFLTTPRFLRFYWLYGGENCNWEMALILQSLRKDLGLLNCGEILKEYRDFWSQTEHITWFQAYGGQGIRCVGLTENDPSRLIYLNALSSVSGIVWEGLGGLTFLDKVCPWEP